ncbi:general secretion pathway protein D [Methylorubrum populi]|uniref:General secretion pathway protein D n=1 Tax=Methylorubrum populi TaxID=223967 RepID=A0A160PDC9_9HYPH|nr:general secretion pathway protein D [Methylorubrum populi]
MTAAGIPREAVGGTERVTAPRRFHMFRHRSRTYTESGPVCDRRCAGAPVTPAVPPRSDPGAGKIPAQPFAARFRRRRPHDPPLANPRRVPTLSVAVPTPPALRAEWTNAPGGNVGRDCGGRVRAPLTVEASTVMSDPC